jgi:hypothetical protein
MSIQNSPKREAPTPLQELKTMARHPTVPLTGAILSAAAAVVCFLFLTHNSNSFISTAGYFVGGLFSVIALTYVFATLDRVLKKKASLFSLFHNLLDEVTRWKKVAAAVVTIAIATGLYFGAALGHAAPMGLSAATWAIVAGVIISNLDRHKQQPLEEAAVSG